jgi:hypothetical protein
MVSLLIFLVFEKTSNYITEYATQSTEKNKAFEELLKEIQNSTLKPS